MFPGPRAEEAGLAQFDQAQALVYFREAPWLAIFPGVAIRLTVLAFNLRCDTSDKTRTVQRPDQKSAESGFASRRSDGEREESSGLAPTQSLGLSAEPCGLVAVEAGNGTRTRCSVPAGYTAIRPPQDPRISHPASTAP